MNGFYYDTCGKLREIFAEHCNLSMEQYEAISGRFIDLVDGIRDGEPQAEIERRINELDVIFDFLLDTRELTLREQWALKEMGGEIWTQIISRAVDMVAEAAGNGATL